MPGLRDTFPLRLIIGEVDYTGQLSENFTFSNVDPGGYEAASFSLTGDLPLVKRNQHVRLDSGIAVAWEGRVKEVDRTLGTKTLIQCEGYAALLKTTMHREIYRDIEMSKWIGPSAEMQKARNEQKYQALGYALALSEAGNPAFVFLFTGAWNTEAVPIAEVWYDGNGIPIGSVAAEVENGADWRYLGLGNLDEHWIWYILYATSMLQAGPEYLFYKLSPVGSEPQVYETKQAAEGLRSFVCLQLLYATTATTGNAAMQYLQYWTAIEVRGMHGLSPSRGALAADLIVKHALEVSIAGAIVPSLWLLRAGESFRGSYSVTQAVWLEPTPLETIISEMALLLGWHWGVWENEQYLTVSSVPRLELKPYPELGRPTAWCLRSECEDIDIREDLENLYDTAEISYTEADGSSGVVTVKLDNPQLDAIELHQTITLSIGTATEAGAIAYGEVVLALLQDQARVTGTATIQGAIHRVTGHQKFWSYALVDNGPMAPWMLKAGLDRLRIPDLPSSDVWGAYSDMPISRVECAVSSDGMLTTVSFGRGPNLVEELTARVERATSAVSGTG